MKRVYYVKLRARKGGKGYKWHEVTIPKELLSLLGWREDDWLVLEVREENGKKFLIVKRVEYSG